MKTEDLISQLAAEGPRSPKSAGHSEFYACAGCGLAIAAAIVVLAFGIRPDLANAGLAVGLKSAFGFAAAAALLPLVSRALEPTTSVRQIALPALLFAGLSSLAAFAALAIDHSWNGLMLNMGVPECLKRVPLIALPGAALMFWTARKYAPTRLGVAGAAIGAFSAAISILAYSWFCQADTVAYVGLWYLSAIVLCAAIGALVGRWVLRW
jgi:hypothetical protein